MSEIFEGQFVSGDLFVGLADAPARKLSGNQLFEHEAQSRSVQLVEDPQPSRRHFAKKAIATALAPILRRRAHLARKAKAPERKEKRRAQRVARRAQRGQ